MGNKVKYNLKNVHAAKLTETDSVGTVSFSYAEPKAIPGAVSISLDAEGETSPFYADGIVYFRSVTNNGYSGDLEIALIPEWFRTEILQEKLDAKGVLVENSGVGESVKFALLFEFDGDVNAIRHVLYNCSASRPSIESETKEDTIEPGTETLSITADPRSDGLVKARTGDTTDAGTYANWNDVKDGDAVLYEGIKVTPDTPIKKAIVKSAFEDANNYMKDGVYLRQVIDVIDEIAFDDVKESHAFGFVYEEILRELQSAGSSGEFYTPRAVTEFMALMIKPQLGEKMADFACGTGGFITSWLGQLSGQVTDTTAQKQLDDSIYGVEKKPFPYLLCVTNMLLHDIEVPNIYHMNSLKHNLLDYTDEDKFDVILMNPPYGGHEDKSIQGFFPDDLASAETADLFLSVIMYRLKKKGRAAVVVPDGFLFGLDNAKVNIKKKLISQFNLHTVVRLPGSVFSPYTSITTNLLFFDNTKPTTETWFYRVDIPSDRKHFSKTKPMELKHFDDCIAWWNDRKEIPDGENFKAQKFTAEYLLNEQGCNIDLCGYPHEEEEILDPLDTIREYQERRTTLNAEIDKVLAELEALLPGGVSE